MAVLVTGAAGFIGFHTSLALLGRGERVIGVDDLNDYYDVTLKEARLAALKSKNEFVFERADIAERAQMEALVERHPDITGVVHLAAQAGVRHSLVDPYDLRHAGQGHIGLASLLPLHTGWHYDPAEALQRRFGRLWVIFKDLWYYPPVSRAARASAAARRPLR